MRSAYRRPPPAPRHPLRPAWPQVADAPAPPGPGPLARPGAGAAAPPGIARPVPGVPPFLRSRHVATERGAAASGGWSARACRQAWPGHQPERFRPPPVPAVTGSIASSPAVSRPTTCAGSVPAGPGLAAVSTAGTSRPVLAAIAPASRRSVLPILGTYRRSAQLQRCVGQLPGQRFSTISIPAPPVTARNRPRTPPTARTRCDPDSGPGRSARRACPGWPCRTPPVPGTALLLPGHSHPARSPVHE